MRGKRSKAEPLFDRHCRRCERLYRLQVKMRHEYPDYHAGPVASFGDNEARLLIVGLAPGLHGANRTGRPFTGDDAGRLLYAALHRLGLSTAVASISCDDGLRLRGCRITNAVKCLPPANRPKAEEIGQCNRYLQAEIQLLMGDAVLFALGRIAHDAVLRACGPTATGARRRWAFAHGAVHRLPDGRVLVDSYHPSRYNTNTGRLTESMFLQALSTAAEICGLI